MVGLVLLFFFHSSINNYFFFNQSLPKKPKTPKANKPRVSFEAPKSTPSKEQIAQACKILCPAGSY